LGGSLDICGYICSALGGRRLPVANGDGWFRFVSGRGKTRCSSGSPRRSHSPHAEKMSGTCQVRSQLRTDLKQSPRAVIHYKAAAGQQHDVLDDKPAAARQPREAIWRIAKRRDAGVGPSYSGTTGPERREKRQCCSEHSVSTGKKPHQRQEADYYFNRAQPVRESIGIAFGLPGSFSRLQLPFPREVFLALIGDACRTNDKYGLLATNGVMLSAAYFNNPNEFFRIKRGYTAGIAECGLFNAVPSASGIRAAWRRSLREALRLHLFVYSLRSPMRRCAQDRIAPIIPR
jgi:hypothetical protein